MMKGFLLNNSYKIREINRKYAKPNVEMSRWVKATLMILRLYLIFLVGLLLYKFMTMI
ncbi:MAG: hypothetical protein Q7U40_02705 [Desulfatirhabdiaceae bacterium]|nr:hypothetical protein [Desulfatirhabdiaceae bacterium]